MYVVMIASECAPVAKVGGLADVVFGLCRELELRGHAVEIILPKYDCMRHDQVWGLQVVWRDLQVPWDGGAITCTVWFGFVHGPSASSSSRTPRTRSSPAARTTAFPTRRGASRSSARRRSSSC
jgi:hypothetical protein